VASPPLGGLPGGFLGASESPWRSILAKRFTEERLTPKRLAASLLGMPKLEGIDYLASEIFRVGFHVCMVSCGSRFLLTAVVELIKDEDLYFGNAWVHVPGWHVDRSQVEAALSQSVGSRTTQVVEGSLRTSDALLAAICDRSLPLEEPFRGKQMGFLTVCGPSVGFYEELVGSFKDADKIEAYDLSEVRSEALAKSASKDGLLLSPPARPENDSSVILGTRYEEGTYLFTGDAGPRALERAKNSFELADCRWMQIPHHGSRSNMTADLVEYFAPETAYVSAPGTDGHPHQTVVDAFNQVGSRVYSTHFPGGSNLYH
jgi:hypothetical protein